MELTPKQQKILRSLIRAKFDSMPFVHQYQENLNLIELAESHGFTDLAEEMRQDLEVGRAS